MSRRRGLTVLESVVTIFVLALVILGLFTLYPMTSLSVEESRQSLNAQAVADSMLDNIRGLPLTDLPLGSSDWPAETRNGHTYQRHLEVFPVTGRDSDFIRGVEVRVSWTSRGRARQVVRELWLSSVGR